MHVFILAALPPEKRPWEADAPARLAPDLRQQILGCCAAHCVRRVSGGGDADGAEGAVIAVVEAHDGDILRYAHSGAQKRPDQVKGNLVVVADDRSAAAELLPEKRLQQTLVLKLHELTALKAGKPENIFIQREKPRVALAQTMP